MYIVYYDSGTTNTRAYLLRDGTILQKVSRPVGARNSALSGDREELLRALAAEGRAVVLVMHDIDLAARFCDRLAVLRKGRLCADGAPADVLTPALLSAVYGVSGAVKRDPYPRFVPD